MVAAPVHHVDVPHDLAAERAILGALLLEGAALVARVAPRLDGEDFYRERHRMIYRAILGVTARGRPVDLITVDAALRDTDELASVGGSAVLALLVEHAAIAPNVSAYVDLVREARVKRELLSLSMRAGYAAQNGSRSVDIMADIAAALERLRARTTSATAERFAMYDAADPWDFAASDFIVEQLLPLAGVVWWTALPKRCKSLLLLYICLAIASGQAQVPRHFAIRHCPRILYVSREDGGSRIRPRRDDIMAAWPGTRPDAGRLRFVIRPQLDLLAPQDVDWLREACQAADCTVLILDTWTALSPSADPMNANDQKRLTGAVVQLAADIGGVVVVVDHSRKNRPAGQPMSSADILGGVQKWAGAEHIVMMDFAADPRRLEVFVKSKDTETLRFHLSVSARDSGQEKFTYAGSIDQLAAEQRAVGDANRQAVLELLQASPAALGVSDLVARLATSGRTLSKDTVQRHLKALASAEQVRQTGTGKATRYFALSPSPQELSAAYAGAAHE
jgi:DNA-binding transcriptional ArsR family regulator